MVCFPVTKSVDRDIIQTHYFHNIDRQCVSLVLGEENGCQIHVASVDHKCKEIVVTVIPKLFKTIA